VEPGECHDIGQRVSVRVVLVAQGIAAPARSVLAKPPMLAGRASTPRGVAVPSPEAGQACASSLQITSLTSDEYIVSDELAGAPAGLRLLGVPVMLTKRLTQAANEHVQLWCPSSWSVPRAPPTVVGPM
jgi:hypothetical protein